MSQDFDGYEDGYAVVVAKQGGEWVVREFADSFESLATSVVAVRGMRSEGAAFAILNVEEGYLVIVRPGPSTIRVLISDATMAVDDDFAAEVLAEAGIEVPDIDVDELDMFDGYPDGDFDILADVGLRSEVLEVMLDSDDDPYLIIERIADELGFSDELADALD